MQKIKTYKVKEIFGPTLQGEGSRAGMPCVFVRLSGCNKWNGKAKDKSKSTCFFCDTDFLGGDKLTADEIAEKVHEIFSMSDYSNKSRRWVVVSGGEPLLQVDPPLLRRLKYDWKTHVAIETNGTVEVGRELRSLIDHLTVSPKDKIDDLKMTEADDLKVLFPYINSSRSDDWRRGFVAKNYFLQPINFTNEINSKAVERGVEEVIRIGSPWKLSLQQHKIIGVE